MQNNQLETIRRRFEALHPVPYHFEYLPESQLYKPKKLFFVYSYNELNLYNGMWQGFLSCMSQELEITEFQDPTFNIARREIIKDLEAQGYRVKR